MCSIASPADKPGRGALFGAKPEDAGCKITAEAGTLIWCGTETFSLPARTWTDQAAGGPSDFSNVNCGKSSMSPCQFLPEAVVMTAKPRNNRQAATVKTVKHLLIVVINVGPNG